MENFKNVNISLKTKKYNLKYTILIIICCQYINFRITYVSLFYYNKSIKVID